MRSRPVSLAGGFTCSSEEAPGLSKSRQAAAEPPGDAGGGMRGSTLLPLLCRLPQRLRQGEQRCEGCSPGGGAPLHPALLQPGRALHSPQDSLSRRPRACFTSLPFSSCCASSRKPSRPDQRGLSNPSPLRAGRHIQGRRLDHLLPGTLWALLCSEQALCTPVRGEPGPSQSSGPWC